MIFLLSPSLYPPLSLISSDYSPASSHISKSHRHELLGQFSFLPPYTTFYSVFRMEEAHFLPCSLGLLYIRSSLYILCACWLFLLGMKRVQTPDVFLITASPSSTSFMKTIYASSLPRYSKPPQIFFLHPSAKIPLINAFNYLIITKPDEYISILSLTLC